MSKVKSPVAVCIGSVMPTIIYLGEMKDGFGKVVFVWMFYGRDGKAVMMNYYWGTNRWITY